MASEVVCASSIFPDSGFSRIRYFSLKLEDFFWKVTTSGHFFVVKMRSDFVVKNPPVFPLPLRENSRNVAMYVDAFATNSSQPLSYWIIRLAGGYAKIRHLNINHMGVSKNRGTPKSSILIGISIINHPFWGTIIFGNTHIRLQVSKSGISSASMEKIHFQKQFFQVIFQSFRGTSKRSEGIMFIPVLNVQYQLLLHEHLGKQKAFLNPSSLEM